MNPSRPVLTPDSASALTRLALSYCLGRGSICLYSRSYVLQVHHPKQTMEYSFYQWRRLRQFLPAIKEPRYHQMESKANAAGQWRLRVASKYFETAWRLLYPNGFRVTSPVLELLGAEAIGSLWADRGRVLLTRGANYCSGRLNLSRYDFDSAELVHEWIRALTGAEGRVHHSPRSVEAPMLYYDSLATETILDAISRTWMAQAPCLARKFRRPDSFLAKQRATDDERLQAQMLMPQVLTRRVRGSLLQTRDAGRRAPAIEQGEASRLILPQQPQATGPRPKTPPALLQRSAGLTGEADAVGDAALNRAALELGQQALPEAS